MCDYKCWILGEGAPEEAERMVARQPSLSIEFRSQQAVKLFAKDFRDFQLPTPPEPLHLVVIANEETNLAYPPMLGVAAWYDGDWITSQWSHTRFVRDWLEVNRPYQLRRLVADALTRMKLTKDPRVDYEDAEREWEAPPPSWTGWRRCSKRSSRILR
jgi:hypothetical protein